MKRFILLFLVLVACSQSAEVETVESINVVSDTTFSFINTNLVEDSENFTNKKTIVVFWADYWSVCRRELPVLEAELKNLQDDYDVIALAHSEYGPTLEWVNENLNGTLKIGFSTPQLRDYFKVVGQPITLVLDLNGEVILREFGEINFSNFIVSNLIFS